MGYVAQYYEKRIHFFRLFLPQKVLQSGKLREDPNSKHIPVCSKYIYALAKLFGWRFI
jgi:hypothetical protein